MLIQEKLDAGERIPVDTNMLREAMANVKYVSLHYRLRELAQAGIIEEGRGHAIGSVRYFYKGRPLKIHANYVGKSNWNYGEDKMIEFTQPFDLAVDKKTKEIISFAKVIGTPFGLYGPPVERYHERSDQADDTDDAAEDPTEA